MGPTAPTSSEREARYDLAVAWSREHFPATAAIEDWIAEGLEMEARHHLERQQHRAKLGRIAAVAVRPLEGRVRDSRRELKPTG